MIIFRGAGLPDCCSMADYPHRRSSFRVQVSRSGRGDDLGELIQIDVPAGYDGYDLP